MFDKLRPPSRATSSPPIGETGQQRHRKAARSKRCRLRGRFDTAKQALIALRGSSALSAKRGENHGFGGARPFFICPGVSDGRPSLGEPITHEPT